MRLTNTTDIPNNLVREIVRFVKPPGCANVDIHVKNSGRSSAGRAYVDGLAFAGRRYDRLIVVHIGSATMYPTLRSPGGAYLTYWRFTRIEGLVAVLAHELRHIWQREHPRGWRVWGARGQYSERDADAYALSALRRWRRR